ncbi:MAG TPA: aminotransferase class III-fold pyridoxal phosphate-dependent enzyme, partial [Gemmatimonadaceae bacterium]
MSKNYPHIVTPPPGPKGKAIIERDRNSTATCYLKEYPLVVKRGQGAMIEDVDGNRYLDFMAGIAVAATGHSHPKVVAAIKEAADNFLHICGGDFYYEPLAALAERLGKLAPGKEPKRVFLTNSGTEAIEGALKLARHSTRRTAIIAFEGSFHGRTYGSLSLTASKYTQRSGMGPFLPEVYHAPYGDADYIEQRLFAKRLDPKDVACIVVEPIQGEGGYIVPPAGFLPALRAMCDKHGILLILDEVQSGIGRTGKMFACEHDGVVPDITLCAKGLAS